MPQSLAKNLVHLAFSTKSRQSVLSQSIRESLCAYAGGVFRDLDSPVIAINAWRDHLHVLFTLSKNQPLSRVVMEVKRASSRWLKTQGVKFATFHWQAGYGAFSVSQSAVERVKEYILRQEEHHRRISFEEEFRLLLKRHHIEFDERYVWD